MTTPPDARSAPSSRAEIEEEDSFRLVDLMESLVRHKYRIAFVTAAAALLAVAVSLVLPSWYRSQAAVLSQEDNPENHQLMSTMRALALPGLRQNLSSQSPETFLAILESRSLRERVIKRFNLIRVMKAKGMDDALKRMDRRVEAKIQETGVITVKVEDRDPQRAADIANAMVTELDSTNVGLRIYRARRARQYLEKQLANTRSWLASVEDSLAAFQERHLVVAMDEQAKAAIEAAAALQAKAMELRIRRGVLEGYASESNPELLAISRELREVELQLTHFEKGGGDDPSIAGMPALGVRVARLMRDVKVGETLLTVLTQEYEDARLDEARDTPVVQILDRAVPAEVRARPRRSIIVLSTVLIAFLLSLAYFVASDRFAALATESERHRWRAIWQGLHRWSRAASGAR